MPGPRRPKKMTKKGARRKGTYRAPLTLPQQKAVVALVHKNAETHQAFHSISSENFNSSPNSTADVKRIMPSINKGDEDYQREGDRLTSRNLTVRGAIVYNPSVGQYGTYANARLGVRLMVVQPRIYSNIDDAQTNASTWTAYLLKKGGTTTAFTGVLSDLWAPINTDGIIKYYDKIFYMDAPYQLSAVGSSLMGKSTRLFTIKMKVKDKILKYENSVSGGIQPTNYSPCILIGYAHMDGSAPDVATTAIQLSYDVIFNFDDF